MTATPPLLIGNEEGNPKQETRSAPRVAQRVRPLTSQQFSSPLRRCRLYLSVLFLYTFLLPLPFFLFSFLFRLFSSFHPYACFYWRPVPTVFPPCFLAGQIWLVRHRDSGEKLVLKEITVKTEEERKEAANEADVLAKVSHVNLIGFIELVQVSNACLAPSLCAPPPTVPCPSAHPPWLVADILPPLIFWSPSFFSRRPNWCASCKSTPMMATCSKRFK